jgi:hypothetical protein
MSVWRNWSLISIHTCSSFSLGLCSECSFSKKLGQTGDISSFSISHSSGVMYASPRAKFARSYSFCYILEPSRYSWPSCSCSFSIAFCCKMWLSNSKLSLSAGCSLFHAVDSCRGKCIRWMVSVCVACSMVSSKSLR